MVRQALLMYATSQWPIILLMDYHSSHYGPATITLAVEHKVILYKVVPLQMCRGHQKGS